MGFQPTATPIGVDNTVKSNLRFDGWLETHPTAETTISVILSDSEESLSNNKDSSLDAQNNDNNKDSSLVTQVQNDGNLSGSLKAHISTVIASEQSERGNLLTTENAPNSNNDKAVGWVSNPPTTPIGVDNTNNFRQPENQPAVGWVSQPTTTPTGVDNTVKSNLRFDGGLETHPTAETTISVILSDSEESLSNNKDSSLDAQNDDNNKDSSLATQVQNDGNLSGSLKTHISTVIASEQSESGNLLVV